MSILTLYPQVAADTSTWKDDSTAFATTSPSYLGGAGAAGVAYRGAIRFPGVHIPQGSVINSAVLTLYPVDTLTTTTINVTVYGNDTADAIAPTSAGAGSAKTLTTASVNYTIGDWTADTAVAFPAVTTIVQEIISRSDWVSSNDLMLLIRDNGTTDQDSNRTYQNITTGVAAYYPKLVIDYTVPDSATVTFPVSTAANDGFWLGTFDATGDIAIGNYGAGNISSFYKFINISIPKGSIVISAYITLTPTSNYGAGTRVNNIYANDIDYAEAPTDVTTANALALTTATISWNTGAATTAGVPITSGNIKSIIQEVIDRAEWATDNPIMLLVKDDGTSGSAIYVASVEHATLSYRPILEVTYLPSSALPTGNAAISFPSMTFDGSGKVSTLNQCAIPVFTVEATASTGLSVECTFPVMSLDAHGQVAPTGSLDVSLPSLSADASVGLHGELEVDLPFWTVTSRTGEGTSVTLPVVTLAATALHAYPGNVAVTLSRFSCAGTGIVGELGSGSITLPKFTSTGTAFDIPVGTFSSSLPGFTAYATGYSSDRFANYVLRYTR